MTKTEAKRIARAARQFGYHRTTTTLYVKCPVCDQKVEETFSPSAGTITQQLDALMMFHLDGYCES